MKAKITLSILVSGALIALAYFGTDGSGKLLQASPEQAVTGSAELVASNLSPTDFSRLTTEPGVIVIDIRTPAEFDSGHIKDALNIDFYDPAFASRVAALDKNKKYAIYCRTGNRSGQALTIMKDRGYIVADLEGGIMAWQAGGLPLQD